MTTIAGPQLTEGAVGVLDGHPVRPSTSYRLVRPTGDEAAHLFAHLDPGPGEALLVPSGERATGVKLIDVTTVELLTGRADRDVAPDTLRALVLDGILDLDTPTGTVTGPLATNHLTAPDETPVGGTGSTIAALSRAALERATRRIDDAPSSIAAWLYACNTVPISPPWVDAADRVEQRLDELQRNGHLGEYEPSTTDAWAQWRRPDAITDRLTQKLYVSTRPAELVEALGPAVDAVIGSEARAWKVGRGPYGLLRPDKFVAYFDDHDLMLEAAARLAGVLDGVSAQGVPFTAGIDRVGVLSWGVDPPRDARLSGWNRADSWRSWITNRLGRLVADAGAAGCSTDRALAYIDLRIGLDGVDPATWAPSPDLWHEIGGAP